MTMNQSFDPTGVTIPNGHFINGRLVTDVTEKAPVFRPSDQQKQANLPLGTNEHVDQAVTAAKEAFPSWSALAPRQRAQALLRWAVLIEQEATHIAQLESLVSSRLYSETLSIDVPAAIGWIRFYAEYADKIDGRVTSSTELGLSLVINEPYGVVAAIAPWNFPLVLATWKIAPAIAAGNCVVLKPSEMTPYSITRLAQLAIEAGIPPGVINVVHGLGEEVGAGLVKHPDVSYVTFTGSTATGARLMADAALHGIKPVSLELGGKGPQFVLPDATNLDEIANHIAWGITRNAGQLCYAGSRLVVPRTLEEELVTSVKHRLENLQAGPTWSGKTSLAPIINLAQQNRIQNLVTQTIEEGADCVTGGHGFQGENNGLFFEPTILRALETSMSGFREEIFGPVLGVQTYDDIEEGIALANHPTYGLTASVYTQDINQALRMAKKIQAGTVWINTWGRKADMTSPFGGMNQSGFGREAGKDGIEKFLRSKAIWIDGAGQ
jgi:aldehyde dehydrogenase (NAD+)